MGASIAKALHALKQIELIHHLLVVKLICAELIEVNEGAEGDQFEKHPCRKIEVGIFRKNTRDIRARRATPYLVFRRVEHLSFRVGLIV